MVSGDGTELSWYVFTPPLGTSLSTFSLLDASPHRWSSAVTESVHLLPQSILLGLWGSVQEVTLISYGPNFRPSHQSLLQLASLYPALASQHHLHEQGHVHLVPRAAERTPDRDCLCGEYQLSPTYRRPENPDQDGGPSIPLIVGICWYLSKLVMVPGSLNVRE